MRFASTITVLAIACVVASACADDPPANTTASSPNTRAEATPVATTGDGPTASSGPPSIPASALTGSRRWGDGRAVAARYDPVGERTVVATTIGVSVQPDGGEPVVLREGLPLLLALAPDGRRAAFTTADGALEMWDLDAGRVVAEFAVPAEQYASLAFISPTDVVAGGELNVTRFSTDGSPPEVIVDAPADGTLGPVATALDGTVAVPVAAPTPTIVVWRPSAEPSPLDVALPDGTDLIGLVWSPDGAHLAVLHQPPNDGESVSVFNVADSRFRGSVAIPNYVTPELVAFAGADTIVIPLADRLAAFDLAGAELDAQPISSSDVTKISGQPDGDAVLVVGWVGDVRRWTPGSGAVEIAGPTANLVDTSTSEDAANFVTVDYYGAIRRIAVDGAAAAVTIDRYAVGEANSVDVAPDSVEVAIARSTGAVSVLRTSDGTVAQSFQRPQGNVAAVTYSPTAPLLATGVGVPLDTAVWDDTVEVTDLSNKASIMAFGGEEENVTGCSFFVGDVEFSPDGSLLAATSHDFTVHVTAVGRSTGGDADVTVLEPNLGTVLDVAFSPDGSLLATSSADDVLRIWNVDGWTLRDEFPATAGGYWSLAFTPDGSALGVADVSGAVSLLDMSTGQPVRTFTGAKSQAGDMEFTPDGTRLVAGGTDGSVEVWSVATGEIEQRLTGHTMLVTDVAVTPDGAAVVSSSLDGTARYWPLT